MGQQLGMMDGPSIPTFNFQEVDYSQQPAPHDTGAFRLVVPVHGVDTEFIWKISQLLQISFDRNDVLEMAFLTFVVQQSFEQMFTNFDRSPAVYIQTLQGSLTDPTIPGLPNAFFFKAADMADRLLTPHIWQQFVVIFRDAAMQLYNYVLAFANVPQYAGFHFTYQGYPISSGSLAFILSRDNRKMFYDIG